ncbi:MAG TPA: sulfurtransferase, partial [Ramlibacter sp.]|nr:sulfurtransferase [Ramlibacter sp.]
MNQVLNIAGYKFVALEQPEELQQRLHASAEALGLRGTILLAQEGINLFLAGEPAHVETFLQTLRGDSRLADFQVMQTWSAAQPFRKLRVKVKREIIRMNQPAIRPAQQRAPAVDPATAKRWLDQGHDDEGRAVVLLDTRNGFEVDHGS